jgi:predicted Zn finger-like uncharacterized protein
MAIALSCPGCQSAFSLKDEYAGKQVRCPKCQVVLGVPVLEVAQPETDTEDNLETSSLHPSFQHDRFLIKQQLFKINENYDILSDQKEKLFFATRPTYLLAMLGVVFLGFFILVVSIVVCGMLGAAIVANEGFGAGAAVGIIIGFVLFLFTAIALSPKRHIKIYHDDSKSDLLLEVKQNQKLALVNATFTIIDPREGPIGMLRKNYLMDMLRRSWKIFNAEGELIAYAKEDSIILSLLRRVLGPMFGLLRTNFIFEWPGEKIFGEYNRKMTLFDRYVMDLSKDRKRAFDRRLAIGMAVMLDTGERR